MKDSVLVTSGEYKSLCTVSTTSHSKTDLQTGMNPGLWLAGLLIAISFIASTESSQGKDHLFACLCTKISKMKK